MQLRVTLLCAATFGLLISCTVKFSDEVKYACKEDPDCGGDGFICARTPSRSACCKPTASSIEVCDKVDNDCDGFVDNTAKQETCNGVDDDCNGAIDDGFDLKTNSNHCGMCNNACPGAQFCKASACTIRPESNCFDDFDDDMNGLKDCADESCEGRPCGTSCVCRNLRKAEDRCDDLVDNELDQATDCADADCLNKSCRAGCTCVADGGQSETDCTDGVDNDLDTRTDCLDPDCVSQFCTPPDIYFRCTAMQTCRCNGGVQVSEVGSLLCRDGIDNDCDGEIDCGEASCQGQSCSPDGGVVSCECGGAGKKEVGCANLADDDGDQRVDCSDSDCLMGTTCTKPDGGGAGSCSAAASCD